MTSTTKEKLKRLSKTSLSCRIITGIIVILLPIFLVFLIPSLINTLTKRMINYSGMNVKNLTEDQMNRLIGMKFSDKPVKVGSSNVITREMLPNNCRVIPPGSVVTMDFDEERLNVHLDAEGNVKKVKRG